MLPPPLERRRRAIVLVHGAWVGEWSWSPVLPLLEASGRPVHAVSLTGHGTRAHQSGPHVTQADHVRDVIGAIETADLTEVTLVGHSYGGRVISAVAQEVPERLAELVFLDAHAPTAPDPGQSPERIAAVEAGGGMLAFTGYDPDPARVGGPEGLAWFLARTMPQSFATFTVPLPAGLPDGVGRTYVFATGYGPTRFAAYAAGAKADPSWRYHEIDTDHWLMFSHPEEVAALIVGAGST
ncbi:MAG: alpha/beta hydrolase family protein [Actinomycetota bacterium]|nr:alpha/beta hydrolase family protein [Actinomycetota bacterium]